ncbi:MAG: hypothetical protein Q8P76_01385 [bacterium]|nr:hypothetical protein [bacterium]
MRSFWSLPRTSEGRQWLLVSLAGVILVVIAFALLVLAGHYLNVNFRHLPPLPDLGHRVLPRWDVLFLFKVGLLTTLTFFLIAACNDYARIPYFLFMAGFWFLVRVASTLVTPFGVPQDILANYLESVDIKTIWDLLDSGLAAPNVLFFSGHTGLPFLGYFLVRKDILGKWLSVPLLLISIFYWTLPEYHRLWASGLLLLGWGAVLRNWNTSVSLKAICLIWSFLMAGVVLLTRVHYTVDVIGAYFMTAGIVVIGRYFFRKVERRCERIEEYFNTGD